MKILSLLILFSVCLVAQASSELRLQKVKELGPFKYKVIFQSLDVKKVSKNVVRTRLVAQWGTERFEVSNGFFTCDSENFCEFSSYERLAMYESCKVTRDHKKVSCRGRLISSDRTSDSNDVDLDDSPDSRDDLSERPNYDDNDREYPGRGSNDDDEYGNLYN